MIRRSITESSTPAEQSRNAKAPAGERQYRAEQEQHGRGFGANRSPDATAIDHTTGTTGMIRAAPQRFRTSEQAAKLAVRAVVAGGSGDRQQPFGRDAALGCGDAFGEQLEARVVVVGSFGLRCCRVLGLGLLVVACAFRPDEWIGSGIALFHQSVDFGRSDWTGSGIAISQKSVELAGVQTRRGS
jgi:hypothetical protein